MPDDELIPPGPDPFEWAIESGILSAAAGAAGGALAGPVGAAGGGVASSILAWSRNSRVRSADAFVEDARRRSGLNRDAFTYTIASNELILEIFNRALELSLMTRIASKRRRASYVFGDALAGTLELDVALLLERTVDAFDEQHWVMLAEVAKLSQTRPTWTVSDVGGHFAMSDQLRDSLDLVAPLVNGLAREGIVEATTATFSGEPAYRISHYGRRVIRYIDA